MAHELIFVCEVQKSGIDEGRGQRLIDYGFTADGVVYRPGTLMVERRERGPAAARSFARQ